MKIIKSDKMEKTMVVFLIASFVLVVSLAWKVLYWVWWKPLNLQKYLSDQGIRGDPYKFLYGNLKENVRATMNARSKPMELSHRIVPRVLPFINQTVQRYGKLSVNWHGPNPRVQVMDPDLVRDILSNKSGYFDKTKSTPVSKYLIAGLVSYEGRKWIKHRRIINPAFHMEKLKMMFPAFYTSCCEMMNKWQKLIFEGSGELDMWPEFQNLTGDVISRAAFGSSYEEGRRIFQLQVEQAKLVIQATQSIQFPGSSFLPTKTNTRLKEINREVKALLRNIIHKREVSKTVEANTNDLLGLLMESNLKEIEDNRSSKNVGITIDEVIDECKLFYFAGQETTSTLLVWTMIVLSMHPEWQVRARDEVWQTFRKRKPNFDELNHLNILTMILYEVLRLYPPLVFLPRVSNKEVKLGKICLPPGVQVTIPTLLIHHDRELWGDDAEEFNPSRFSNGISMATKNQLSFFPFGWGPRICIGQNFAVMEVKIALAMILQHFSFELSPSYIHAPCTVVTLQPQYGAQLILHKL